MALNPASSPPSPRASVRRLLGCITRARMIPRIGSVQSLNYALGLSLFSRAGHGNKSSSCALSPHLSRYSFYTLCSFPRLFFLCPTASIVLPLLCASSKLDCQPADSVPYLAAEVNSE